MPHGRSRGFALIITLALLALLMLALYGLSALVRVSGRMASVSAYQMQAEQNALLGLDVARGELSRHTADPSHLTGMAGITGIAAGSANRTRHWCGVWASDGTPVAWLVSGAASTTTVSGDSIELVANGSVGAAAANSEHVLAGKVPIVVSETPGAPGVTGRVGSYAYVVLDEGVKISAYARDAGIPPVIFSTSATSAAGRLRDALANYAAKLPQILSYEQLSLLPTPASALTPSVLQDNFHHVTLTSRFARPAGLESGLLNVNTNSVNVWRSLLQTYNQAPGVTMPIPSATVSSKGTAIVSALATYAGPGKSPATPFRSVSTVGDFLATIFPANGSPTAAEIMAVMGPMLVVRSDTFTLRAYGEALNPMDPTQTEATARCEARVQRQSDGRFDTLSFRWLGPEDL